jgi:hypothetical protein
MVIYAHPDKRKPIRNSEETATALGMLFPRKQEELPQSRPSRTIAAKEYRKQTISEKHTWTLLRIATLLVFIY